MKYSLRLLILCLAWVTSASAQSAVAPKPAPLAQTAAPIQVPTRWWETISGLKNVSLKDDNVMLQLSLNPQKSEDQLKAIKNEGFAGIQVFAPEDGGKSYNGLDSRNHFAIEAKYGSVADFKRVVDIAHQLGMHVIIFNNLGYIALDASVFLKACDDVREGRTTRESSMFFWSDQKDAPAPTPGNNVFLVRPKALLNYDSEKVEHWEWSEPAQHYYWSRWPGKDMQGNTTSLPQYNWNSVEWQEEAEKTIRFWMDTGIDGMVVDAVNWYVGADWVKIHKRITDVIRSYGEMYTQPEGGGAFHEDPVAWITEGGWTSVQDYGLQLWWEKPNQTLENAIAASDPRSIEESLRNYHDRVIDAGGVLNMAFLRLDDPQRQHLADAVVTSTGQLVTYWAEKEKDRSATDQELQWLLKTKSAHPALSQIASRRKLPTAADNKHYAFLRTAKDDSERILVVMNFWATPQMVEIDASGISAKGFVDLRTGEKVDYSQMLKIQVDKFGYRLLRLN
jgi:hypothetical protein